MSKFNLSEEFDPQSTRVPSDVKVVRKHLRAIRDYSSWSIRDFSEFFEFLDGKISTSLACDFAEEFSLNDEQHEVLDRDANSIMEELRQKLSEYYYSKIGKSKNPDQLIEFCIKWLNDDLNELAVNFAEMVVAVEDIPIVPRDLRPGI